VAIFQYFALEVVFLKPWLLAVDTTYYYKNDKNDKKLLILPTIIKMTKNFTGLIPIFKRIPMH
jgi:hypothetical protein